MTSGPSLHESRRAKTSKKQAAKQQVHDLLEDAQRVQNKLSFTEFLADHQLDALSSHYRAEMNGFKKLACYDDLRHLDHTALATMYGIEFRGARRGTHLARIRKLVLAAVSAELDDAAANQCVNMDLSDEPAGAAAAEVSAAAAAAAATEAPAGRCSSAAAQAAATPSPGFADGLRGEGGFVPSVVQDAIAAQMLAAQRVGPSHSEGEQQQTPAKSPTARSPRSPRTEIAWNYVLDGHRVCRSFFQSVFDVSQSTVGRTLADVRAGKYFTYSSTAKTSKAPRASTQKSVCLVYTLDVTVEYPGFYYTYYDIHGLYYHRYARL